MKPNSKPESKARQHFYSVSIRTDGRQKNKDHTSTTKKKVTEIKNLAASMGFDDVTVKMEDETLAKLGIFFMQAPERFAEDVKNIDGIKTVEKPAAATKKPGRGKRR